MGRKRVTQIDAETGEVLDGLVAYVAPKRQNGFTEGWYAMAHGIGKLFAHSGLVGADFKVLFLLLDSLDFENRLLINQAAIARELGMHRQHVQRSIKQLLELGALLEGPKIGQNRSYQLNPNLAWKGSATNHRKALETVKKTRMKTARIKGVIKGGKVDSIPSPKEPTE